MLSGKAQAVKGDSEGQVTHDEPLQITAVPYYAWNHRGPGEMAVWIARTAEQAIPWPRPTPPTIAGWSQASTSYHGNFGLDLDTLSAVNDAIEPKNSRDLEVPRLTWWDHKGTREWVQYDLRKSTRVSGVHVYWFDDTGSGGCRVPQSWRLLYRDGDSWKPVGVPSEYGTKSDTLNLTSFPPVTTQSLRLEVELQQGYSGGLLEWRVLGEEVHP